MKIHDFKITYNYWQIAYRTSKEEKFRLISNPTWAWAADPFLVEFHGEVYLFAELFLYKSERNGVIGFCKLENGEFSDWAVTMDEHWHLSYPNVFVKDDKLYMCPESYQKKEIAIYELIEFPNKWRIVDILLNNVKCVDSTFMKWEDKNYMFTYAPTFRDESGTLFLYEINQNGSLENSRKIAENVFKMRPGGNVFRIDDRLIRVAQNCEKTYGGGLIFSEIKSVCPIYKEEIIRQVLPEDIPIETTFKIEGIHTYNRLKDLEVIDVKYKKKSISALLARRRIQKVFLNKYL